MNTYKISFTKPHQRYIDIEFSANNLKGDSITLHLPKWRPGRYEIGNFAKNVQKFSATNAVNEQLQFRKISSHSWQIFLGGNTNIKVSYNYYASELNAGSTFLDAEMLYANPVNCFMYLEGRENEPHLIDLSVPTDWKIACSLESPGKNLLQAANMQELMDSPFIASPNLDLLEYKVGDVNFQIWINGKHTLDKQKLEEDFKAFSKTQIDDFGGFPTNKYLFLIHILPFHAYHGVEHLQSTVICIGTDEELKQKSWYNELLGVSSHELYHVWNIKALRPAEMFPYDFTRENYSRLGYVAEGVTTYFGDVMLARAGVFSDEELLEQLSKNVQKHMDNGGRLFRSVADSSFDTWLDGYSRGVPNRKVSIYTEGSLIAMICDVEIARETQNKKSLSDVMKLLYQRFALNNKGYTENDYWNAIEEVSGSNLDMIRKQLVENPGDFIPWINQNLEYLGLEIVQSAAGNFLEAKWGTKLEMINGKHQIVNLIQNSLAEENGLWFGDNILSINGKSVEDFQNDSNNEFFTVEIERMNKKQAIEFALSPAPGFKTYSIKKSKQFEEKEVNFTFWKNRV